MGKKNLKKNENQTETNLILTKSLKSL